MKQPPSTPNAMARRFTFAATIVGKSFCPCPPVQTPRKSPAAVAVDIRAHKPSDHTSDHSKKNEFANTTFAATTNKQTNNKRKTQL
jgi:hypothetical protein